MVTQKIDIKFDDKISAYIEANKSHADNLFRIARDHRATYMTLNSQAIRVYRPILEWFIKQHLFDACIDYIYANIPDCLDRVLFLKRVQDIKDSF